MNSVRLLMPLLLCNVGFVVHAQTTRQQKMLLPAHYADVMRPTYDTAKHCITWPAGFRDVKNNTTPRTAQVSDAAIANFHLTRDINTNTESFPGNYSLTKATPQFAVLNNVSYFYADNGINGGELWRSDGTAAGTYMVKDINSGETGSNVFDIVAANGKIYFAATTGDEGTELWISDGTAAGTNMLKSFIAGPESGSPYFFYVVDKTVFFTTQGSYNFSSVLWKTDGTTAGTVLVKDLNASSGSTSAAFQFASANGLLYFTAYSFVYGRELWRSDGTDAGTYMVKDINPINYDYDGPMYLTAYNNKLYFVAMDGVSRKLWLSDGTQAGTIPAPGASNVFFDNNFFFQNVPFAVIADTMYLKANAYATGNELYKYNPLQGCTLVKDITAGATGSIIDDYNLIRSGSFLYFTITNPDASSSLWSSDGSPGKTLAIKDFEVGDYATALADCYNTLYFSKKDTVYGSELWKSNGTSATTGIVADIYAGGISSSPYYFTPLNNKVLFSARTASRGVELVATNGMAAGTQVIRDINKSATGNSYSGGYLPQQAAVKNGLVFISYTPQLGNELYRSDGTTAGTTLLADLVPGEGQSTVQGFTSKGGFAYFSSQVNSVFSPAASINLTDGKMIIKLADVDYYTYYINSIAVADNGLVFYLLYNKYTGQNEVWRTNGKPAGTFKVYAGYSNNAYIITAGNNAYFSGNDGIYGTELWKSNGTVAGTRIIKDINNGNASASPYSLFAFNGEAYFGAYDGAPGASLWKTNGTLTGTIKLADVQPGPVYNYFEATRLFCVSGAALYFRGFTYANGTELWKTNGTAAGTVLVKDIFPGSADSRPEWLTDVNGALFFYATDPVHGTELWASKGKSANTLLVKDLTEGPNSTFHANLCSAAGKCFLSVNGYLWSSDGTATGTKAVDDPVLVNVTSVSGIRSAGNKLFFGGFTYKNGYELYEGDASLVSFASVNSNNQSMLKTEDLSAFTANIAPNPVTTIATLQLTGSVKTAVITISDVNGKTIWSTVVSNSAQVKLPAGKLSAGIYFVLVKTNLGSKTLKLVKQ